MLIASIVFMLIACVSLAVGNCFVKQNIILSCVLKTLQLISLICLAVCCATFKNNFSGFTILLILSITPMFLNIYEFSIENKEKTPLINENSENNDSISSNNTQKREKLAFNWQNFIKGLSFVASAFCIAFCALYLGKESAYGFLIGVSLALFATFLEAIIQKNKKNDSFLQGFLAYLEKFIIFLSAGLLFAQIFSVLAYSFNLANLLFSFGCLAFTVHILLSIYLKSKFDHLAYVIAVILLISTILV